LGGARLPKIYFPVCSGDTAKMSLMYLSYKSN